MIYLDNAATTKPDHDVLQKYMEIAETCFGNPGSFLPAKQLEDQLRLDFLKLLNFDETKYDLIFTSGGTEANNLAIFGLNLTKDDQLITSNFEHASVYEPFLKYTNSEFVTVSSDGYIDTVDFQTKLSPQTKFVSFMHVNNEIGTEQDVEKLYKITKAYNSEIIFMVDSVQGMGKVKPLNFCPDLLTISSHKIYGPKMVGALIYRKDIKLSKQIYGGTKEHNLRGGTQSLPAQAAFYLASKKIITNFSSINEQIVKLKKHLMQKIQESEFLSLNIKSDCNVISVLLNPGFNNKEIVNEFAKREIFLSTKSADTNDLSVKSRTLKAIGFSDELCDRTLRISLSHHNTCTEIDIFFDELQKICTK
ncbi:MAG: cysteine desulfurase family protein [Mycoplasmatales bacterium]